MRATILFVILWTIAAALVLLPSVSAGHENPTDWIGQEKRKNARGELCCGQGVDCFEVAAVKMLTTPAGYAFPDEPNNIIPFVKFAPSADEYFWRCRWGGETKCLFAPIGGT